MKNGRLNWQTFAAIKTQLPPSMHHWVSNQGSFTRKMQLASQGAVHNHLLYQGIETIDAAEVVPMELAATVGSIFAREVFFEYAQRPWIWARSLFAPAFIEQTGDLFLTLGDKPLGEILFADKQLTESAYQFAKLTAAHPWQQKIKTIYHGDTQRLWARRSLFRFRAQPVLVQVVFLPDIIAAFKRRI